MTITFVGHGYVGLVSAAVFAELGNTVWVIGHTKEKIENLKKGILPIYEPGLEELVKRNVKRKRLLFTLDYKPAISDSKAIFIAVGTPPKANGEADLSVVFDVAKKIGENLGAYSVVVTKSTVPVGTNRKVQEIIEKNKPKTAKFDVASAPEFLREGQAIGDTMHPDRVVIGTDSKKAEAILVELHKPIGGRLVLVNIETAEMIKYASNAFLATKISFANAIAQLSEKAGANGVEVLKAVGEDKRIGSTFLSAGAGYGGSCFPKDVKALIAIAKEYQYTFSLLIDVEEINKKAMEAIVEKAERLLSRKLKGATVALLGLSFKPDTDDMRDAPSIVVVNALSKKGVLFKVYDPIAMDNAKRIFAKNKSVIFCNSPLETVVDADLLIVITEWTEFKKLDFSVIKNKMKSAKIIDARNMYSRSTLEKIGFDYVGVGQ